MNRHQAVEELLLQIESEMRGQSLWSRNKPSTEALQSSEPFCVDTLSFFQWVQWIMIPRFHEMISKQQPLPQSSSIAPMAEEALRLKKTNSQALLLLFNQLDNTLTLLR
ncbi:MAG: YqcC family protein [Amphritea sp.]